MQRTQVEAGRPSQLKMIEASVLAKQPMDGGVRSEQSHPHVVRVVFCWTEASGYMAACWRALARRPGIDLHVVHLKQLGATPNPFLSEPLLLDGISNEQCASDSPKIDEWLLNAVAGRQPDVLVLCGWLCQSYTRLVKSGQLKQTRVLLGMDSPWRGTVAQRLARFRLAGLVRRVDAVVTCGERSREYARRIGVPLNRIYSGYYGFDYDKFSQVAHTRSPQLGRWPRQFLFVGRYVHEKGLTTLAEAYSLYRRSVSQPWGLTCCGSGAEAGLLQGVPGIVDAGFTQPKDLPAVFGQHGAFVLASHFEPWGVVLAEAAATGMPVICTTACGAGLDVVRPYFNGLVVAPEDAQGLALAMRWIHEHESELPAMGLRGNALVEGYSAEAWAARWNNYFLNVLDTSTL